MKIFVFLSSLLALAACSDFCYDDVVEACTAKDSDIANCNAKYGAAGEVMFELQNYANLHVTRSFDYLLWATNFGAFEKNRIGFEKLFRKLSDRTWDDAIDLIKYITKRGGIMDFNARKDDKLRMDPREKAYDLFEVASLSRALDSQKILAEEAHHIHAEATRHRENYHDPEVASYLENNFLHKQAETIRDLAGHTNDLISMLEDTRQSSLSVFLFDEYLKSKY